MTVEHGGHKLTALLAAAKKNGLEQYVEFSSADEKFIAAATEPADRG